MIKIGETTAKANIGAHIEPIHLTDWMFTLGSELVFFNVEIKLITTRIKTYT